MQELYGKWSHTFTWSGAAAVSSQTNAVDLSVLAGTALHRQKRCAATEFWDGRHIPNHVHLAHNALHLVITHATEPRRMMDKNDAEHVSNMLTTSGSELKSCMVAAGVLQETTHGTAPHMPSFRRFFVDLATVAEGSRVRDAVGAERVCTCHAFLLRAQCEHTLFVEGLALPARGAVRIFDRMLMPSQSRGRPRKR